MKVICINDTPTKYPLGPDGPENILITKGKTYVILCDDGNANSMGRTRFISLEEFREGQLNKIL